MADDLGERTEAPTSHRMSEARQRGQIAKSQDLASAIDLIGGVVLLIILGAGMSGALASILRRCLESHADSITPESLSPLLREVVARGALAAAPFMGIIFVVCLLAHLLQVGPLFTLDPLRPKFDRLNPIAGLARLGGTRNLVRSLVNTLKLGVVLLVAWLFLRAEIPGVAGLPRLGIWQGLEALADMAIRLAAWLLVVLLIIGVIDWLYQRWQHTKDLRMTKEQVKDERRSMEGDPKVKAQRQKMARQMMLQRINQAVPQADVIVTNPTHFSVAIRYDESSMRAPRVVAKGVDFLAMRIRHVALIHRVPIVERPPLARALYAGCEVGQEVPPEMYQAVAELLAFVYRLEHEAAA